MAAINADLFHLTRPAAPFGVHIEDGHMRSSPSPNPYSYALGIDDSGRVQVGRWPFSGRVYIGGVHHSLAGYNQTYPDGAEGIFLYDRHWGSEFCGSFLATPVPVTTVRNGVITRMDITGGSVAIPADGFILVGGGGDGAFLNLLGRPGTAVHYTLGIANADSLQEAIGVHALIVDDGRPRPPDRMPSPGASRASRTAVGTCASGTTLRLVTIDGTASFAGVTMTELAEFMSRIGSHRAVNLDGGGSTTLVTRPLGAWDPVLTSAPRTGFERAVPNALAVVNIAPPAEPDRLFLSGPSGLLIGTDGRYTATGHDRNYQPLRIDREDIRWEVSDPELALWDGESLQALGRGEVRLEATLGSIRESVDVRLFGGEDITAVHPSPADIRMLPGQRVALSARVEIITGDVLRPHRDTIAWDTDFGRVKDHVYQAPEEEGFGTLAMRIDGHEHTIPIRVGGRREPFFTFREWQTTDFRSYPDGLPGSFDILTDPRHVFRGDRAGRLTFSFPTETPGEMIAYGQLGSGQISMGTNNVGVSAYVMGDSLGYPLYAEVIDGDGRARAVRLTDAIDWDGWTRVQGAIDPGWKQPLVLSNLYVLREDDTLDDSHMGTIHIDQIEMIKGLEQDPEGDLADVKMWVGSTEYTIRGQAATMDAAPFIRDGRTLIPVRYLAEAFDARADWNSDPGTGLTTQVTLTAPDATIVIPVGKPEMTVITPGGDATTTHPLDVPAVIVDGRTYLPFRAIGEWGFGATVDYSMNEEEGGVHAVWLNRR